MFIIDAHLDLATNAIALNRDLTKPVHAIRMRERLLDWKDTPDRSNGTVSLPELQKGNIALVVATIISRFSETAIHCLLFIYRVGILQNKHMHMVRVNSRGIK